MEGLKILSKTGGIPPDTDRILFATVIILTMLAIVFLANYHTKTVCAIGIAVALIMICVAINRDVIIKVTPTEEKYYIDVTKYEVMGIDGDIFTLREK